MNILTLENITHIFPLAITKQGLSHLEKAIMAIALVIFSAVSAITLYHRFYVKSKMTILEGNLDTVVHSIANSDHLHYDQKLSIVQKIGQFVKSLTLETKNLIDADLEKISNSCPNIQHLSLNGCIITKKGTQSLPTPLKKLFLNNLIIRDNALEYLPKNLQVLQIDSINYLQSLKLSAQTNLISLVINNCHNLNTFKDLPKNLSLLHMSHCRIDTKILRDLPKSLTQLILSNIDLTDDDLDGLPENLERLQIVFSKKLTDKGIAKLSKLQNLKHLCLLSCDLLTDAVVDSLPPNLQSLECSFCPLITDAAVAKIPKTLTYRKFQGDLINPQKK